MLAKRERLVETYVSMIKSQADYIAFFSEWQTLEDEHREEDAFEGCRS